MRRQLVLVVTAQSVTEWEHGPRAGDRLYAQCGEWDVYVRVETTHRVKWDVVDHQMLVALQAHGAATGVCRLVREKPSRCPSKTLREAHSRTKRLI